MWITHYGGMEMSRKWKIVIAGVVALVVVVGIGLSIAGVVRFRRGLHGGAWESRPQWESEKAYYELEVELVDDDGDGVPDRGVIELPREAAFGRGHFFGGRLALGRSARFGPWRGMGFGGHPFGSFPVVGGLIRLVFLAGAIVLGVVLYRQWRKAHPQVPPASE
jgi:hypothetical protein